jgi:hypothetical protein
MVTAKRLGKRGASDANGKPFHVVLAPCQLSTGSILCTVTGIHPGEVHDNVSCIHTTAWYW